MLNYMRQQPLNLKNVVDLPLHSGMTKSLNKARNYDLYKAPAQCKFDTVQESCHKSHLKCVFGVISGKVFGQTDLDNYGVSTIC